MINLQSTSLVVFVVLIHNSATAQNVTDIFKGVVAFRDCITNRYSFMCIKERALSILNETVMDERPINFGFIEIQKNPEYFINSSENENFPREVSERSSKLSEMLFEKIIQFFKSRTVKLNLSNVFEGEIKFIIKL
ncbi:hypothetical protein NQ314_009667 [Rhamnusium bicolor]|uniref:Uncharacterized protein n=1 Tax=Rhamnusium bicolor TaxID=1586634 RepID=A0AAV8XXE4_9CUCU|nr:hypothetical protein NQ314_009667 [Rhamnusium bicolor]